MQPDEIHERLERACAHRSARLSAAASGQEWEVQLAAPSGLGVAIRRDPAGGVVRFEAPLHASGRVLDRVPGNAGGTALDVARRAAQGVDAVLEVEAGPSHPDARLVARILEDGLTAQEVSRVLAAMEIAPALIEQAMLALDAIERHAQELTRATEAMRASVEEASQFESQFEGAFDTAPPPPPPSMPPPVPTRPGICANPACAAPLSAGSQFCPACGTPAGAPPPPQRRSAPTQCSGCGGPLVPGNKFCTRCGTPVP